MVGGHLVVLYMRERRSSAAPSRLYNILTGTISQSAALQDRLRFEALSQIRICVYLAERGSSQGIEQQSFTLGHFGQWAVRNPP